MKLGAKIGLGVVGVLVVMQVIRPERDNPPVTGDVGAPPEVAALLKRACYDCHSNETVWPWYTNVAPVSWFTAHHVHEGRGELNFSEWAGYADKRKRHKLEEIEEQVRTGEMPIDNYVWMHPEAKLTDEEKKVIEAWARPPTGG